MRTDHTPRTKPGETCQRERNTAKRFKCPHCENEDYLDRDGRRYFCHRCKKTVKKGLNISVRLD